MVTSLYATENGCKDSFYLTLISDSGVIGLQLLIWASLKNFHPCLFQVSVLIGKVFFESVLKTDFVNHQLLRNKL